MGVIILLPPSETKTPARGNERLQLSSLSLPELNPARAEVLRVLADVSSREDAAEILKVGPRLASQVHNNTRLREGVAAAPAAEIYSGVLYDALDYSSLSAAARTYADERVLVVSALYGAVGLADVIAPYRLSMAVKLPGLGGMAAFWRPVLPAMNPSGSHLIVDCRSASYIAAYKPGAEKWVALAVPGATHMAKHTRGLAARWLCENQVQAETPEELAQALWPAFSVEVSPPKRGKNPWVAAITSSVTPR